MLRSVTKFAQRGLVATAPRTVSVSAKASVVLPTARRGMATIMEREIDSISGFTEEQQQVRP